MTAAILFLFSLGGCTFSGKVTPDLECTSVCEDDVQSCYDVCETECVNADGDLDEACDTDCHVECDDEYDTCTVTCTGND